MVWLQRLEAPRILDTQTWQIGSQELPTVCLCCGTKFDTGEHSRKGPYPTGPYLYVCQSCWEKSYLYFPDKAPGAFGSFQSPETIIASDDQDVSSDKPMSKTTTQVIKNQRKSTGTILGGVKVLQVSLSKLKLDPRNVRLVYRDLKKDADLQEALWKEPKVREWYVQIREEGGISEPLAIDSNYLVREGNERLICLRKLSKEAHDGELPEFSKDHFDSVPCQILPPNVQERDIAIWLTRIHVRGKHRWESYNKARMIYELWYKHHFSYEEIRKRVGLSKKTVQNMMTSYREVSNYHELYADDEDWFRKYSYFYEVFKSTELRNWGKRGENMKLFADWVYVGKFARGEDVRKLKKLMLDQELFDEFKKANVTRAREILAGYETMGSKSLDIISKATDTLRNFPLGELRAIVTDPVKWNVLNEHYEEMTSFMRNAKSLKGA
jgi:hypothetical protein